KTALEAAKNIIKAGSGRDEIAGYIRELEETTGKEIRLEEDSTIPTVAKVEIAENYDRSYHLIKYKPSIGMDHLILHELIHIHFYHEARQKKANQLFTVQGEKVKDFKSRYSQEIKKLVKQGYPHDQVDNVFEQLFHGI